MIPFEMQILVAAILFTIGLIGLLTRRNLIFMLMSVEIMMNAGAFAFVAAGARWIQPDGQVMFLFVLTVAAAEVAIALALLILMHKLFKSVDTNQLNSLKN
ncbi:MAG: NADH-quinone oxidoreductase subunit NuoK [Bacteroidales bacterium]|nr:NADH-quinone oxidoreductase subunit NuoK [Bacteroidales bacterium]